MMTLDRSIILLRNETARTQKSVTIRLEGRRSPRDGYGARVEVEAGGKLQVFEYQRARSYLSACDPRIVVGMGNAARIDRITVHWPSGQVEELREVKAGSALTISEGEGSSR